MNERTQFHEITVRKLGRRMGKRGILFDKRAFIFKPHHLSRLVMEDDKRTE